MKKIFTSLICLIFVLLPIQFAIAEVLNFDDLAGDYVLNNQFYKGVLFTAAGTLKVYVGNQDEAGYSSPHNSIGPTQDTSYSGPFTAKFPTLVNFVQITGGDQGYDFDKFKIEVYDSNHVVISSAETPVFGGNPPTNDGSYGDYYTLSISGLNIAYAKFIPESPSGYGVSWDDLKFGSQQVVPEPATMLLLGSGLVGLAAYGRKKFFKK